MACLVPHSLIAGLSWFHRRSRAGLEKAAPGGIAKKLPLVTDQRMSGRLAGDCIREDAAAGDEFPSEPTRPSVNRCEMLPDIEGLIRLMARHDNQPGRLRERPGQSSAGYLSVSDCRRARVVVHSGCRRSGRHGTGGNEVAIQPSASLVIRGEAADSIPRRNGDTRVAAGTGSQLWAKTYSVAAAPYGQTDYATSLAVGPGGTVYVTGYSEGDYGTVAYQG
jgi:hypothetical protein